MREVIKTGRTVEDATELALAELGVSAEEAGIEVLELPQRRLFKSIPAKVRAYVEDEEVPEAPAPKEEKPLPKAAPKAAESPMWTRLTCAFSSSGAYIAKCAGK